MTQHNLFPRAARPHQVGDRSHDQYFTPWWAAEALVDAFLPGLGAGDAVLEPSCGLGAFLAAIPRQVAALGVEIDSKLAETAERGTGRRVIVGDFREVELGGFEPSAIVGNPPYDLTLVEDFLARAHALLPDGGRCGFLLPAYACQTPRRVLGWSRSWGLSQALVPRTLFMRSRLPLLFVTFTRGRGLAAQGFALYAEAHDVTTTPARVRELLEHGAAGGPCWRAVVAHALATLGGQAELAAIYRAVEPRRPTGNPWWREKVRQVLQKHFLPVERGVWSLSA